MTVNFSQRFRVSDPAFATLINSLINRPWSPRRHCWWLVRQVVGLLSHDLPRVVSWSPAGKDAKAKLFAEHEERGLWRETKSPGDWAIVLLDRPWSPGEIEHCGVWLGLDRGGVLHTDDPHGVVFDPLVILSSVRHWVPVFLEPNN